MYPTQKVFMLYSISKPSLFSLPQPFTSCSVTQIRRFRLFNNLCHVIVPFILCMGNCILSFLVCNFMQSDRYSIKVIFGQEYFGCICTPVECRPVKSIPPLLIQLRRVGSQRLHLPHCPRCALGTQTTHDHNRRPSILRRGKIDILFGQHAHERFNIRIRPQIPRVKQHILKRFSFLLRRTFVIVPFLRSNNLLRKFHHVALPIHHLVVIGQLIPHLFRENFLLLQIDETSLHKDGAHQGVFEQVERSHDALYGESDDHSFPNVESYGHADSEGGGSDETAGRGCEVFA
mmetsp:Transcript_10960/g.19677  ORF Transcript_10960/g.19677 Transcript_10960/m.19677 type:complete len:289 (-) Transcript_10960:428-1294(-)